MIKPEESKDDDHDDDDDSDDDAGVALIEEVMNPHQLSDQDKSSIDNKAMVSQEF